VTTSAGIVPYGMPEHKDIRASPKANALGIGSPSPRSLAASWAARVRHCRKSPPTSLLARNLRVGSNALPDGYATPRSPQRYILSRMQRCYWLRWECTPWAGGRGGSGGVTPKRAFGGIMELCRPPYAGAPSPRGFLALHNSLTKPPIFATSFCEITGCNYRYINQ
jgi:hypothetical protein